MSEASEARISIIIPIYNAETYLTCCLGSLVHQTCDDFEVICIDDQSNDASFSIARSFEQSYPERFRVFRNERNVGQGRTRERGIGIARGEYLMFVDSDDYVASDYVETFLRSAKTNQFDIVVAGHTRDIDGTLHVVPAPQADWAITTYAVACAKLFRISFLLEHDIRFAQERRGEDIFFNVACYCSSPRVNVLNYAGYHYRLNRASTTSSITPADNFERSISSMFHELLDEWISFELTPRQRTVVAYAYFANMINALVVYDHGCGPKAMRTKRKFVFEDAERLFPDYRSFPFFQWNWANGQSLKIRITLWIVLKLHRLGLDKALFWLISLR